MYQEDMPVHVWGVGNQKGGVGKTTTAVALAGLLSEDNKKVLLIDLDPHGSMTSYFKQNPDDIQRSVLNLFTASSLDKKLCESCIIKSVSPNIDLLPSSTLLATLERKMSQQEGKGLVLSKALATLWDDYDYAIIDTPPILGILMINALAACQRLLVPVQTEFLAIKGLDRMLQTLKMVMKSLGHDLPYLILPTLFDRRTQAGLQSLQELRRQYSEHLWQECIPVDTRFRDASREGVVPSKLAPNTRGVRAYRHLLAELNIDHSGDLGGDYVASNG